MKQSLTLALAALLLVPAVFAQQQKCTEFRMLYTQTLTVDLTTGQGGWAVDPGSLHALLNEGNAVTPTIEYLEPANSTGHGVMGMDRGGTTKYVINATDSFTMGEWHATYQFQPGKAGLFPFRGVGRIIGGTGAFQNATGSLTEEGPFIFWFDGNFVRGKYQAALSASVCVAQ